MANQITVNVDESLSDLIPGFLKRKRDDIAGIIEATPLHDYDSISRAAHRLKGEGGSYCFDGMTEMGRLLEGAVANRDDAAIMKLAQQLQDYVSRVEVVFQPSDD
jgi:HPt (histidine-containing phosphotransfer) domain-containing protein